MILFYEVLLQEKTFILRTHRNNVILTISFSNKSKVLKKFSQPQKSVKMYCISDHITVDK